MKEPRTRTRILADIASNPDSTPRARLIATCLRDNYQSIEDPQTGARMKLYFEPGIQQSLPQLSHIGGVVTEESIFFLHLDHDGASDDHPRPRSLKN